MPQTPILRRAYLFTLFARTHSTLPIPVQPRNSTVQCIFLAYFTPYAVPFGMSLPIPDKKPSDPRTGPHHAPSAAHQSLLSPVCFHGLTNCFSRKPFALINICVAPRVSPPTAHAIQEFTSRTNQPFYRHTVMNSLSSRKKSSALESATSTLFHKNTWGGGGMHTCRINEVSSVGGQVGMDI